MAEPRWETLQVDAPAPHVVRVTLNRPDSLNALNTRMGEELRAWFRGWDPLAEPDVRAVILTGAGGRAFCAGADLKERRGMSEPDWRRQHLIYEEAFEAVWRRPTPVVAAVNGVALGGGCELALASDLIVAAEHARFGMPEVLRGILPGGGGTQRLPRRIGPARAKELLYTGRLIEAAQAHAWGLTNEVVPAGELEARALALAQEIAGAAPIAVRGVKRAVDRGFDLPLAEALAYEIEAYNTAVPSEDRHEGVNAFNEKRTPVFRNR